MSAGRRRRGRLERALEVGERGLGALARGRDLRPHEPRVHFLQRCPALLFAGEEALAERERRVPLAAPVQLVGSLDVEPAERDRVAEALRDAPALRVELEGPRQVAEVGGDGGEVVVAARGLRRVGAGRRLDALAQVAQPFEVAGHHPGEAARRKRVGAPPGEPEHVGHPQGLTAASIAGPASSMARWRLARLVGAHLRPRGRPLRQEGVGMREVRDRLLASAVGDHEQLAEQHLGLGSELEPARIEQLGGSLRQPSAPPPSPRKSTCVADSSRGRSASFSGQEAGASR